MTYVMSDIHGEYSLFLELLSNINFSDNDILYICGDIIEKGPDSIRLAKYIFSHHNIKVIRGNHEEAFLKYFYSLMREREGNYEEVLEKLREYIGGDDAHLLDWDVVDSIEKLPYYIETDDYICVHAGVPLDKDGKIPDLKTVPVEELIYNRKFKIPEVAPLDSRCVFYGHTSSMSVFGDARIVEFVKRMMSISRMWRFQPVLRILGPKHFTIASISHRLNGPEPRLPEAKCLGSALN